MSTVGEFSATLGDDCLGVLEVKNFLFVGREDGFDADTCFDGLLLLDRLFVEGHEAIDSNNYSGKFNKPYRFFSYSIRLNSANF
jgi:hypothetical protein